jgi:hypothetical protein
MWIAWGKEIYSMKSKSSQVKDETELETLVTSHVEAVEPELIYLDHQRKTERGPLDVLCVDQEGVFVVMELKIKEDDAMFMQALEYLDYVNENVDRFASFYTRKLKHEKQEIEIDKSSPPRIVLVAPSFSETLKKCAKYVDEDYPISLKQFKLLRHKKTGEAALVFIDVPVEEPEIFVEAKTPDDHLGKISDPRLRDLCKEIIENQERRARRRGSVKTVLDRILLQGKKIRNP